jgi:hypothetical protein
MSIETELLKLYENVGLNPENIAKAGAIFEHAVQIRITDIEEDLEAKFEVEREQLVEALDLYMDQRLDESVDDIRKLMLLAVSEIGGPGAVDAFIKKVAALAREGALSAASSDWAQGSDDGSARNRQSVAGGGTSKAVHSEETEAEIEEAVAVFEQVGTPLDEAQYREFKDLVGDLTYSGDAARLRAQLTAIRNQHFPSALTEGYADVISRTVRKG